MACGGCGGVNVAAAKRWLDCFVSLHLGTRLSTTKAWTRKAHADLYQHLASGGWGDELLRAFPGIGNVADPGWGNDAGRTAQIVAGSARMPGSSPLLECFGISEADADAQIESQTGSYYTAFLSAMGQIVASETESKPTGKKALISVGVLLATVAGAVLVSD